MEMFFPGKRAVFFTPFTGQEFLHHPRVVISLQAIWEFETGELLYQNTPTSPRLRSVAPPDPNLHQQPGN
jgi:hypothetical protein